MDKSLQSSFNSSIAGQRLITDRTQDDLNQNEIKDLNQDIGDLMADLERLVSARDCIETEEATHFEDFESREELPRVDSNQQLRLLEKWNLELDQYSH